ncbi:MAG TPA: FAD-dependent oxidoreductase [Nakamurella sp.]|jgi:NADPH-dependent 2,4-dienoyl-CoA reductase/sulfur reductase-like enzyme
MTAETFVIVGASLAGGKAAETLREEGFDGRIVLIGAETEPPYERPPLSKGYLTGSDERSSAFLHGAEWWAEHDIDWRPGTAAVGLDLQTRTLALHPTDTIGYDRLLIATGSAVRTLDVPGADLDGVRYLRTLDQADALLAAFRRAEPVVVIGAGWIGLETAAAARGHGCPVTVVEMASLPLQRVLGDEVATVFRDLHLGHGVDFRFGAGIREFRGTGDAVRAVVLTDGTELTATTVVVGVGIRPVTDLASSAGLEVDNGIVTDAHLRTSDPFVYACGDVASSFNPLLGRQLRVEHWANALNGGPAAARSMLGEPDQTAEYAPLPYFFSDQYDLGMEYSGWVAPGEYDRVVFRGDPTVGDSAPEFVAFWLRDDLVLAGMNVNIWDVNEDVQVLVKAGLQGRPAVPAKLADPDVPLPETLA